MEKKKCMIYNDASQRRIQLATCNQMGGGQKWGLFLLNRQGPRIHQSGLTIHEACD